MPPPTTFYDPKAVNKALSKPQEDTIMIRDGKDEPGADGKFRVRRYILESASEAQDVQAFAPDTSDLPETHEHFVRHFREVRNGRELMFVEIGVRPKAVTAGNAVLADIHGYATTEPGDQRGEGRLIANSDGLADADDATLETEAAKAGLDLISFRKMTRNSRIKAIREARKGAK